MAAVSSCAPAEKIGNHPPDWQVWLPARRTARVKACRDAGQTPGKGVRQQTGPPANACSRHCALCRAQSAIRNVRPIAPGFSWVRFARAVHGACCRRKKPALSVMNRYCEFVAPVGVNNPPFLFPHAPPRAGLN